MTIVNAASYQMQYYGKTTAYGSTVGSFAIDGRRAWCLEHNKTTPPSQTMSGDFYTSTEPKYANIRKIMYYGWFGYQMWEGMNGLTDAQKNVIMSKALSHAYSGTSLNKGKVTEFYNYATAQADPLNQNNLMFSKNDLYTYYDKNAKVQKSESVKLNGPSGYHFTFNTGTKSVKIFNESRNQSGESVDIYGGDTLHLEADASYTGTIQSGKKSGGFTFAPLIVSNGKSENQRIGTWYAIAPEQSTYFNATFNAVIGNLKLRKTDMGGKLLDGAIFHVSGHDYEKDVTVTNGEIVLNNLLIGDYTVTEKSAPHGYLINTSTYSTTIKPQDTSVITIADEAPTGQITIKKSDTTGIVQGEASLEGAEYTIYDLNKKEVGKIITDKEGNGRLDNLPLGTYTVKETKAPVGYNLDWNTYTVDLTYKDQTSSIILGHVDSKDMAKIGSIEILKSDTDSNPLKGGEFGIYANADMYIGATLYKKGQLVMSIKTDEEGMASSDILPYGSYYVKELKAPDKEDGNKENFVLSDETQHVKITGYSDARMLVVATPVAFIDKKVYVTKTDITGSKEIKGAKLQVTDLNGEIMDSWISDGQPHSVKGLIEGHDYILTETSAPDGYVKAQSIKFTVSKEKKDETIVMKDTQVKVSKTDVSGKKELEGAKLEVRDEFNQVVDSWTSTKDPHYVNGLEESKTYTLIETTAPDGYVKTQSIKFTVSKEKKDETIVMKDTQVKVSKTDVSGKKELEGAKLEVRDEFNQVVDSWTSTKDPHYVNGLEEGKTYTLIETTAPDGYIKAESITFTVTNKKDILNVTMKDAQMKISKVDEETGEAVLDAEFSVFDKQGNLVDQWITDGSLHAVNHLEVGQEYVIKETKTPKGYLTIPEQTFIASSEDVSLEIKEQPRLINIQVNKLDAKTKQLIKDKDCEFTLYSDPECTKSITSITSHDGMATFKSLRFGTYYVKETKAPLGYYLSQEVKKVVLDENVEGDTYTFDYMNTPIEIIHTGDSTQIMMIVTVCIVSLISIGLLLRKKKTE